MKYLLLLLLSLRGTCIAVQHGAIFIEELYIIRHIIRLFSIGLFSLVLASGCTALTGKTAGKNVDDAGLTASVKTNLAAERGMQTLTAVDVDTNQGVVYLNGVVDSPVAKQRAAEIAHQTSGVTRVVNNLQVAKKS